AAAMKDRDRRQGLRRCRTIELCGELDGVADLLDGHARRLLGQNRAGAEKAQENAQEATHGRQPRASLLGARHSRGASPATIPTDHSTAIGAPVGTRCLPSNVSIWSLLKRL